MKTREQIAHDALHTEEALTAAEIFCAKVIEEELTARKIRKGSEAFARIVGRSAELLECHREEVRSMYRASKGLLRKWILEQSGIENMRVAEKMARIGLTGNIGHDMEVLARRDRR